MQFSDVPWGSWRPKDDATLLFVVESERILLIEKKRGLGAGKVNGPGGRIHPGESAEAAAVRELSEELCVRALPIERAGLLQFQFVDGYSLQCTVFKTPGCIGEPKETDEAVPLWTPLSKIPYHRMWEDDCVWMPLMLSGRPFFGRALFDGDRMLGHDITAVEQIPAAAHVAP